MQRTDVTAGSGRQLVELSSRAGASAAAVENCNQLLQRAVVAVTEADGAAVASDDSGLDPFVALRDTSTGLAGPLDSSYKSERDRSEWLAGSLARLERACKATLRGLALAVETKDDCGGGHLHRVSRYGMLLTALVAPEHTHDPQFEYGFLLHDIGELMVPDFVRNKPGTLTDAEWAAVRAHPENGRLALEGIDFLAGAREIVHCHHERWDGNGYPRGLKGTEIPLGARIFRVCDAFDAMTSERPYRGAMPLEEALKQLRHGSGTQFWPRAVEAFLAIPAEVLEKVASVKEDPA